MNCFNLTVDSSFQNFKAMFANFYTQQLAELVIVPMFRHQYQTGISVSQSIARWWYLWQYRAVWITLKVDKYGTLQWEI